MSSLPLWAYAVILAATLLGSLVLTPLALALAVRLHVLDHPAPNKAHTTAVPYLGGAAIVISFAGVVLVATAIRPPPDHVGQLVGFMGLGVLLALVGLTDDVRGGLSPWLRLALEAGAGAGMDGPPLQVGLTGEELEAADAVVLLTDHDDVDYELVTLRARYLLDCRHRCRGERVEHL